MALVMVNREELYNFETVDDAIYWMENNKIENREQVIIVDEEDDEELEAYLEEHAPIEIL